MVDMKQFANTDGKTTEEKLQDEIAGDTILLVFVKKGEDTPFFKSPFK